MELVGLKKEKKKAQSWVSREEDRIWVAGLNIIKTHCTKFSKNSFQKRKAENHSTFNSSTRVQRAEGSRFLGVDS